MLAVSGAGGFGGGDSSSTVFAVGGAGGNKPPECVVYDSSAAVAPLDVFILLDSSGSMGFSDGGATKWDAMKAALGAFANSPDSAGMGVALNFFPIINQNSPSLCNLAGGECAEWCKTWDWCWDILTPCETTQDCVDNGGVEACSQFHVCDGFPEQYCEPGDIPCADGLGECVPGGTCHDFYTCSPGPYSSTVFGPQKLPQAANGFAAAMNNQLPDGGTPTLPAMTGVVASATNYANNNPSHKVIILLATDGTPTVCDHDIDDADPVSAIANIATVASGAADDSIETFVIGVFTAEEAEAAQVNLNLIADAGGTGDAFIISTDEPLFEELLAALNQVRAEAKSCEFELLESEDPINYDDVWVRITNGDNESWVSYVGGAGKCDPQHGGFYYDVPSGSTQKPSRVILCAASCAVVNQAEEPTVELYTTCPDPTSDD